MLIPRRALPPPAVPANLCVPLEPRPRHGFISLTRCVQMSGEAGGRLTPSGACRCQGVGGLVALSTVPRLGDQRWPPLVLATGRTGWPRRCGARHAWTPLETATTRLARWVRLMKLSCKTPQFCCVSEAREARRVFQPGRECCARL